ncbi:ribosome recycling factor [Salicola sp. Rm-C-2C1-2]|uniref:ribosome recycling factor n=1 Tax=Salicola sp. Rm-C-2C1-2 TaxID=3141321 RepID=UPI0032E3D3E8
MLDELKQDTEQRMHKAVESVSKAFARIRTGRAHPSILDDVQVEYYGMDTPLKQLANVSAEDSRTLAVSPYEKKLAPKIEKAIMKADLGLNPATTGEVVRVPMPTLTEDTRKEYVRHARNEAEQGRVAVRGVRRDVNSDIKELLKEKEITEDEEKKAENEIQKLTDKYVAKIDELLKEKESDLMAI